LIAGRKPEKAREVIARHGRGAKMIPVPFDRDKAIEPQMQELRPDLVVDASGPFQAYGDDPYRVARAAITCGASYVDLADDPVFVCGIGELEVDAKARNRFALSGASSCVALSSAIYRDLAQNFACVTSISAGIAPSPRADVGISVMRAVANSAGKPFEIVSASGVESAYPFTSTRSYSIAPPGYLPLRRRTFSVVAVPDLSLASTVVPQAKEVWFGAAPVPALQHAILRMLARLVKRRWLDSLNAFVPIMTWAMRSLTWGEYRGGMIVEVAGTLADGTSVTRSWHLIAEGDAGPAIPAMASAALISRCLDGRVPRPGARPATHELELDDFRAFFRRMPIRYGERTQAPLCNWPVFRRVLASAWNELPREIRQLHQIDAEVRFAGRASVQRGRSLLARIIGYAVGFPPSASEVPLEVTMRTENGREYWRRDFDGHVFSSSLSEGQGRYANLLRERFGPVHFAMALVLDGDRLNYVPRGWTFLGIPMPNYFAPTGEMCEFVADEKFHFKVEINMRIIGHVVTYQGWLQAADTAGEIVE
jgi:hypothetical protein